MNTRGLATGAKTLASILLDRDRRKRNFEDRLNAALSLEKARSARKSTPVPVITSEDALKAGSVLPGTHIISGGGKTQGYLTPKEAISVMGGNNFVNLEPELQDKIRNSAYGGAAPPRAPKNDVPLESDQTSGFLNPLRIGLDTGGKVLDYFLGRRTAGNPSPILPTASAHNQDPIAQRIAELKAQGVDDQTISDHLRQKGVDPSRY